jgi:hypothetical protein
MWRTHLRCGSRGLSDFPIADQTTTIKKAPNVKILLSANNLSLIPPGLFPTLLMAYSILAFS